MNVLWKNEIRVQAHHLHMLFDSYICNNDIVPLPQVGVKMRENYITEDMNENRLKNAEMVIKETTGI